MTAAPNQDRILAARSAVQGPARTPKGSCARPTPTSPGLQKWAGQLLWIGGHRRSSSVAPH
jgi:hypothetical protein